MSKGLELAQSYYREFGRPMLEARFPFLLPRLAAGLAGEGSECFGFDDALSQDHDFGPGFCLWLSEADFSAHGAALQAAYEALPPLPGYEKRKDGPRAGKRVGVFSVSAWYGTFIGREQPPTNAQGWLRLREDRLAACVNGRVFEDNLGAFTGLRNALSVYPEGVRNYKIVSAASTMGQSGQYNFARCMKRGDTFAAAMAKAEFLRESAHMLYLLNGAYMPFYKWAFRGLAGQKRLAAAHPLLKALAESPVTEQTAAQTAERIEAIAALVIPELQRQELTDSRSDFLCDHLDSIYARVRLN